MFLRRALPLVSRQARTFWSTAAKDPPRLVVLGAHGLLGYNPTSRVEHIVATLSASIDQKAVASLGPHLQTAVHDALHQVDTGNDSTNTPDYIEKLNATVVDKLGEQNLSEEECPRAVLVTIQETPDSVHTEALARSLATKSSLFEILQDIRNSENECKFALIADIGPLFKVR